MRRKIKIRTFWEGGAAVELRGHLASLARLVGAVALPSFTLRGSLETHAPATTSAPSQSRRILCVSNREGRRTGKGERFKCAL